MEGVKMIQFVLHGGNFTFRTLHAFTYNQTRNALTGELKESPDGTLTTTFASASASQEYTFANNRIDEYEQLQLDSPACAKSFFTLRVSLGLSMVLPIRCLFSPLGSTSPSPYVWCTADATDHAFYQTLCASEASSCGVAIYLVFSQSESWLTTQIDWGLSYRLLATKCIQLIELRHHDQLTVTVPYLIVVCVQIAEFAVATVFPKCLAHASWRNTCEKIYSLWQTNVGICARWAQVKYSVLIC